MTADRHAALLDGLPPETPAVLVIEPAALERNYRRFASLAPTAETGAVVKADGYGLGSETVVRTLVRAGCRTVFVATLGEARRVRKTDATVGLYVLDGLPSGTAPIFAEIGATPVLASLADVEEWSGFCRDTGRALPAAIQIDTGMHRLGLSESEVRHLAASPTILAPFKILLILSQLALADDPRNPTNAKQRQRFERLAALLPEAPWSLAAASGMFLEPAFHFDLARPGMPLFGGIPCPAAASLVEPVGWLYARILQVHEAPAGETVGYGAQRRFDRPVRLATLSIGYADGYGRALSDSGRDDGAVTHIGAYPAPVVGRISMDLTTIDVSAVPPSLVRRGTFAQLMGDQTTVDDLATKAGTIPYEILTRIGPRVRRVVVEA
ncbi:MAG: alanine racemase [Hyphomicrobiaceae bacterium]